MDAAALKNKNPEKTKMIQEWVKVANQDGWVIKPLYKTESIESAARGNKEVEGVGEFLFHAIARGKITDDIHLWGPDGLQIIPPMPYRTPGAEMLQTCNECGATGVKTFRYSFAGRACNKCLPTLKKKHEYPGWTN